MVLMMHRIMKVIGFACAGFLAAALVTSTANAETVTVEPTTGGDAYKAIQAQLDKAKNGSKKMDITVKAGSYKLSHGLNIYGNTTLIMYGVNLELSKGTSSNLIKIGDTDDNKKGYYYENIALVGGNLNANQSTSTGIKIAHGKNISLKELTIRNTVNAHLVEVAGVDGFTVDGCTFSDQVQKKAKISTPEAIQLDILVQQHMKNYRSEVLTVKNASIRNSTFRNVPRGVGTHTAVLNDPIMNVNIQNNKFLDCKSGGIQIMYYNNCVIEGNEIVNAPRGIVALTVNVKGVFLPKTLVAEGKVKSSVSNKYKKPVKNQKVVIRNNSILLSGKDIYSEAENEGILVNGFKFAKALKKTSATDAVPKGDYYASGFTVTKNSIVSNGQGIRLVNVRSSVVSRNLVTLRNAKSKYGSCYGVQLTSKSTGNIVSGNKIKNPPTHGIFLSSGSSAKRIKGNTILNAGRYGISVQGSKATIITGNTVKKAKEIGISVIKSSNVGKITKNTLVKTKKYGIYVKNKSKVKLIRGNKISGAKRDIFE